MSVAEHASAMFRKFAQNGKFLGREVNVIAVLRHSAAVEVDAHARGLDRLVVTLLAKVEQVGDIAVELRGFAADQRHQLPIAGATAAQIAYGRPDRGKPRLQVMADR